MKEKACDSSNITNEYLYEHRKFVYRAWFSPFGRITENYCIEDKAKKEKWNQLQHNNQSTEVQMQEKIYLI